MTKSEQIPIQRYLTHDELLGCIRSEKNARVLKILYYIKYRYEGNSVKVSSERVGISSAVGHRWQKRWNESGYDGLIPRYTGGRPAKLSEQQKTQLKQMLNIKKGWTTKQVKDLIVNEFGVEYSIMQIRRILKKLGIKYAKPYQHDYRKPEGAEDILKKDS